MKKILLIIIAIFPFAIADAAENSNTVTNCINSEIKASEPITYWSGWAPNQLSAWTSRIYIKVYRTENTCDSFYAVATKKETSNLNGPNRKYEINETLAVRELENGRYYVVYEGVKYFFSM